LVCLWCIWKFNFCRSFCGKLLFCAISCINVHSFCFLFGVSGRDFIPVMWCLTAETVRSMEWFERKLMVVSIVIGLRYISISRSKGFRIMSRSRKLVHPLFSYVGLSFMSVLMTSGWVLLVSCIIAILAT